MNAVAGAIAAVGQIVSTGGIGGGGGGGGGGGVSNRGVELAVWAVAGRIWSIIHSHLLTPSFHSVRLIAHHQCLTTVYTTTLTHLAKAVCLYLAKEGILISIQSVDVKATSSRFNM